MEVRGDVDAKHLQAQRAGVLDVDLERDPRVASETPGVGRREVELDPVAQRRDRGGAEHGRPAIDVGVAGEEPGLGEQPLEPERLDVLAEPGGVLGAQEVGEVRAHERLVSGHGREAGDAREVVIERGDGALLELLEPGAAHVGPAPRQREVREQPAAIEHAGAQVTREAVIAHVRLERVERRWQGGHRGPQLVEVRDARGQIELPVDVRRRAEPRHQGLDPGLLLAEGRPRPRELLQLGARETMMDRERAEALRALLAEVGGHERDEAGEAGAVEALEQEPSLVRVERPADETDQPRRRDLVEAAAARERELEQLVLVEARVGEARRMAGRGGLDLGLVVEHRAGLVAQAVRDLGERDAGAQEQLSPIQARAERGVAVARAPAREERVDLGERAAVLQVHGAPVVVFLGAGDQTGERGRAIVAERQPLELLDIHGGRA